MTKHQFVLRVPQGDRVCLNCPAVEGSEASLRPCHPDLGPPSAYLEPEAAHPRGIAHRMRRYMEAMTVGNRAMAGWLRD